MRNRTLSVLFVLSLSIVGEAARIRGRNRELDQSSLLEPNKNAGDLLETLRFQDHTPRQKRTERMLVPSIRYQSYYQRKKAEKDRGDKEANAWFEKKREYERKARTELTKRIRSGTYSTSDLEQYQRRLETSRRYEAKKYSEIKKSRSNIPERYKSSYQRKKEAKERGDKGAIAWFANRKETRRKNEMELTKRIQSNTYSTSDLERHQRRAQRSKKYRHKQKKLEPEHLSDS
ncbi:uncharacterized protein FA14DRAFT_159484 [Meira miltonrushii]|uniref:Uncharacterized protein n=1 Tax=Meira miltonrushii TaxID=1280837 RepID=A0A316VK36_9BASI|nr:uncharacterized protein FA14DRAFT_159484 [Meira miltonrushii]PWN37418.1 hypothetical protein FA14DRAFT_159484 [Meira miltonrushii]